ncbi:MAG TPA: cytochrome P450 [Streptosporangiaceae bacterium]|nr:cytochrome P450 [Streptosporangiaceae bacterium]
MTIVTELELPVFDLTAADLTGEVYHQRLARLREQGWLAGSPLSYIVLDRESGEFFLRNRATAFPGRQIAEIFGITGGPLWEQIDANILNLTGPDHRRLRSLVGPAFTPRAADRWRPAMRGFLERLWHDIDPAGTCEFVAAVAKPYPSLTIAAVLGAPLDDAPRLHEWSNWVQRQFDIRALANERPRVERAVTEAYDYIETLLRRRRAGSTAGRPSGGADGDADLIDTLLAAEVDGDRLTHAECVNLVMNVLAGGVDTTQSQLAHGLRLFAEHPEQWALLAERPELVPRAVDEILRVEPITPFTARICVEPIEYRGVTFPAGTIIAVCAERANREPGAGDGPGDGTGDGNGDRKGEEFDITAERDGRLLTFGAGAHYCLGANLARAELEEALSFLAPRMPGLSFAGPPRLGGIEGIYGIEELPLTWRSVHTAR